MNKKLLILFFAFLTIMVSSCGDGNKNGNSGESTSIFGKSDKEKADEFVKTLGKDANVLLVLPAGDPKGVYYEQENLIKYHNIETDSTQTIPYGDIDESTVSNVLAGKSNILVVTQDYDEIDGAYVYDVAKKKFSKIDACPKNMRITDAKLSKSNQCITFTCDTIAEAPKVGLMVLFDPSIDFNEEQAKTGYYEVVNSYDFDGKLIKTKRIPISNKEWYDRERAAKEEQASDDGDNGTSSSAVYLWRCDKCGEERESVDRPSTYGCEWNGHQWTRLSRVR